MAKLQHTYQQAFCAPSDPMVEPFRAVVKLARVLLLPPGSCLLRSVHNITSLACYRHAIELKMRKSNLILA